jgi:hypothetical protein
MEKFHLLKLKFFEALNNCDISVISKSLRDDNIDFKDLVEEENMTG